MAMNEYHKGFSSARFEPVADHFVGFRAFRIPTADPAKLTGIFKYAEWKPGVNKATCMALVGVPPLPFRRNLYGTVSPTGVPEHDVMEPECYCGFWAYTNGTHRLGVATTVVLGVIEGWGRMVIGPRGFRCEYARILAFAFPTSEDNSTDMEGATASIEHPLSEVSERFENSLRKVAAALQASYNPSRAVEPVTDYRWRRPWEDIPETTQAAILDRFVDVDVFRSVKDMQTAYPLSDLTGLVGGETDG